MTAINTPVNEGSPSISNLSPQPPSLLVEREIILEGRGAGLTDDRVAQKVSRKPGDEVNRFLLCSLVGQSAKYIKAKVEWNGHRLPVAAIVKGLMRAYVLAAKRQPELLAGPQINMARLRSLIDQIMKTEIKRHSDDLVRNNQARLAQANHLGDETKIKTETEALERAIESRNKITLEYK